MIFFRSVLGDIRGQDLLEYAMLTALVALLSVAAWGLVEARLGEAYVNYDTGTQGLWRPPDPGGSSAP